MSSKNIKKYLLLACVMSAFAVGGVQSSYASNIQQNSKQIVRVMQETKNKKSHKKHKNKHKHKHKQVREEECFLEYDIINDYIKNKIDNKDEEGINIVKKIRTKMFIRSIISDIMAYLDIIL